MTFTIFSLVLIVAITFSVGKSAYNGYQSGSTRAIVSLLCAVFSFGIGSLLSSLVISSALGEVITYVFYQSETFNFLFENIDRLYAIVSAVVAMAISPIIFVIVFAILRAICHLVTSIVYKKVFTEKEDTKGCGGENDGWYKRNDKQIGAVIGGFTGFLVAVILFSPIIGTLKSVNTVVSIFNEDASEQEEYQADADEEAGEAEIGVLDVISDYANDFAGTVVYYCGGKAVYDMNARTMIDGHTVVLTRELEAVSNMGGDLVEVIPSIIDLNEFGSDDVEKLEGLCEEIDGSYFWSLVSSSFISSASRNWAVDEDFIGISRPDFNNSISAFTNSIFSVLATTTPETVGEDLSTIIRVCGIIMDSGILDTYGDYEMMMELLEDGSFLSEITAELEKNPRTEPLIDSLHLLAMNSLVGTIKFEGYDVEQYQDLMDDLTEQFNRMNGQPHEKKVETLANYTVEYLQDYGVDIPAEVAKVVADAMISELPDSDGYVTAEQMQEFFEKYGQGN